MARTYLFYGEDSFRIREKTDALILRYRAQVEDDFDLARLDAKSATLEEIVSQIMTVPFLATTRLIVVYDLFENLKPKQEKKVVQALERAPASTVVLLVQVGRIDPTSLLLEFAKQQKGTQPFNPLSGTQLRTWVLERARQHGKEIAPQAIELLVQWIGADLWRMDNELHKLAFYSKQAISEADVRTMVVAPFEYKRFAFYDLLIDTPALSASVMRDWSQFVQAGEPSGVIVRSIHTMLLKIIIIKAYLEDGLDQQEIARRVGMSSYPYQIASRRAKRLSFDRLKRYQEVILTVDERLKSGKILEEQVIDYLLCRFWQIARE